MGNATSNPLKFTSLCPFCKVRVQVEVLCALIIYVDTGPFYIRLVWKGKMN